MINWNFTANKDVQHVGGINDGLGGVDPFADDNLLRLFLF